MIKLQYNVDSKRISTRIEQLAGCSSTSVGVTRLPFTVESLEAERLVEEWMKAAGMTVRKDGLNNIIGRYEGKNPTASVLLIGSHLDSVIEAGKFDGVLGVITGIEVVQTLRDNGVILDNPLEVVGFCDEEGVRFHSTFLGSKAIAGTFTAEDLERADENGITIAEALKGIGIVNPYDYKNARRTPEELLAYLEVHIEQGPVLEKENKPVGVVSGIAGATRFSFEIIGKPGHAGTVPVAIRQDALLGASDLISYIENIALENKPLVATVGKLTVSPGASNVIPGLVTGTLDIRDLNVERKQKAIDAILAESHRIAESRGLQIKFDQVMEVEPVYCNEGMIKLIEEAISERSGSVVSLVSGAGHDAMAMADVTKVAMIFVRCKDGLSHHPDEFVTEEDMGVGAEVLYSTVIKLASKQ
ncbi:allantoate amidohydrolase [Neobacillus massiliamazoniensis]|uniref:Hydantoinase/carbamoylase family amidase n=1 Tax=Neobacillus massiliamazoniensis TaxID=1499688 RepID=A0A0U1P451_9BACI|nr:allantoate amidohydrolase [Neobacillus massiliamazoniensis]CRK85047.1 hydantoinase/carbamoylase family amidase [Neobacillus massiliamazoniensis]